MRVDNQLKINKDLKKMLIFCIISSIFLPIGIPLIVIGASKTWILLTLGIIMTVFGFYGSPILWVLYGNLRTTKQVVNSILEENLTNTKEISSHLQMPEKQVKEIINKSITKQYLKNLIFDGETLKINDKSKLNYKNLKNKCPNCGGLLEQSSDEIVCPYCGSKF